MQATASERPEAARTDNQKASQCAQAGSPSGKPEAGEQRLGLQTPEAADGAVDAAVDQTASPEAEQNVKEGPIAGQQDAHVPAVEPNPLPPTCTPPSTEDKHSLQQSATTQCALTPELEYGESPSMPSTPQPFRHADHHHHPCRSSEDTLSVVSSQVSEFSVASYMPVAAAGKGKRPTGDRMQADRMRGGSSRSSNYSNSRGHGGVSSKGGRGSAAGGRTGADGNGMARAGRGVRRAVQGAAGGAHNRTSKPGPACNSVVDAYSGSLLSRFSYGSMASDGAGPAAVVSGELLGYPAPRYPAPDPSRQVPAEALQPGGRVGGGGGFSQKGEAYRELPPPEHSFRSSLAMSDLGAQTLDCMC